MYKPMKIRFLPGIVPRITLEDSFFTRNSFLNYLRLPWMYHRFILSKILQFIFDFMSGPSNFGA